MTKRNKPKFEKGQKVIIVDSYVGYFRNFKDRVLTVEEVIPQDDSIDDVGIKIKEISDEDTKYHLIYQANFRPA